MHEAVEHLPRGRGILGLLIDQPLPLRLHDVSDHPRSFGFPIGHPPMRSFLGAPIVIRGEAWGNLYLTEKLGADDFDDDDLEAIVVLAEWAAIAIDNARLFGTSEERRHELERANGGLEASRDIAIALGGETDLSRILELIVKRARALVGADSVRLWLVEDDQLRLAASAGNAAAFVDGEHAIDHFLTGGSLRSPGPITITPASRDRIADPAQFGVGGAGGALVVPLVFRGRGFGVLAGFDQLGEDCSFTAEDERALRAFAASAATAVATAENVEAKRLRDTIRAAEDERGRFARDLHDQTLQGLAAIKLALRLAQRGDPDTAQAAIEATLTQLDGEIAALRGIITDLRPPALDELGLEPAIRSLALRSAETNGFELELHLELGDQRFDRELETIAYRVAQEALTNTAKHAAATHVTLALSVRAGILALSITDDGRGFDQARPIPAPGYGLPGMRERAEIGRGHLSITSGPGEGTTVALAIPVASAPPERA